jgi:Protein of unknown function (DUF3667)
MEQNATTDSNAEPTSERALCRNCGKKMAKKGNFCPHCGQKNTDGVEPFRKLLARFWKSATHLDNKFVTMCWQLFVPAMVTKAWAAGRTKQYPHPVQFFFIAAFFFLLAAGAHLKNWGFMITRNAEGEARIHFGPANYTDSAAVHGNFYKSLERYVHKRALRMAYDSLPAAQKSPAAQSALDSVLWNTSNRFDETVDYIMRNGFKNDTMVGQVWGQKVTLDVKDIVRYEPQEVVDMYKIDNLWTKLFTIQGIKALKDPVALVRHFIGSLAWTILSYIAFMSALMTLLYWKKGHYFVEHFVFLLHRYSAVMLVFAVLLGLKLYTDEADWLMLGGFAWAVLVLPFALKRYYQQSWWMTLLKTFLLWAIGIFAMVLLFVFAFIVTAVVA